MSFEGAENAECQGDVEDDSGEAWSDATVESQRPIRLQNMLSTITKSTIFVRVNSLHFGFDDVNWIIRKHRYSTSKATCDEIAEHFRRNII